MRARVGLVVATLMLQGCGLGLWKAQRALVPAEEQATLRPPGLFDRGGARLLLVEPSQSVVELGEIDLEEGRRARVTVAAHGRDPPVLLAVGIFFVPAIPLFLATAPAQFVRSPRRVMSR